MNRFAIHYLVLFVLITLFIPAPQAMAGGHAGISVVIGHGGGCRDGCRRPLLRRAARRGLRGSIRFVGRAGRGLVRGAARVAGGALRATGRVLGGVARGIGLFGRALFGYCNDPLPQRLWENRRLFLRA